MLKILFKLFVLVGLALFVYQQIPVEYTHGEPNYKSYVAVARRQIQAEAPPVPTGTPTVTPLPTPTSTIPPTATLPPGSPTATPPPRDDCPAQPPADAPGTSSSIVVSRGKIVSASSGHAASAIDGIYLDHQGWRPCDPTETNPEWMAIEIGYGPTRLLLNWTNSFTYNYNNTYYGALGDYKILVSGDSTNGFDGAWSEAVPRVVENSVRGRMHSFEFTGKKWVKLFAYSKAESSMYIHLDEVDVHDISTSRRAGDTWFFMGDSIINGALNRTNSFRPSFADLVNSMRPNYYPALINGGIAGESSMFAPQRVEEWMQMNPDVKYWPLSYGTNDAINNNQHVDSFRGNMQAAINKIKAAGKVPIVSKIPYSSDGLHNTIPLFNNVVDELTRNNGLIAGPDLYQWFKDHPGELSADGVHPNAAGYRSINRLWAEAMVTAGVFQ